MVLDIVFKGQNHIVKEVPIKTQEIKFDKNEVDSENKTLKKIRNPKYTGEKANVFVYEDGSLATEHFKAIKGVAKKGFKKTESISEDKISIENTLSVLSEMVSNDHTYYLVNESFKRVVKELGTNKCMMFKPYAIRGFKAYKGVVFYCESKDRLILKLVRSDIKDADMPENDKVKETEVSNVAGINEDELVC